MFVVLGIILWIVGFGISVFNSINLLSDDSSVTYAGREWRHGTKVSTVSHAVSCLFWIAALFCMYPGGILAINLVMFAGLSVVVCVASIMLAANFARKVVKRKRPASRR